MEALANLLQITPEQLMQVVTLGIVLLIGLVLLRVFLKLTATLFRIGCFGIFLIVAVVYVLSVLSP
ncbi:MAG: hypothetical protein IAE79_03420 [Anaerolinea sp.]|nr:hypothetical protein [Anaerolinea sp.]